MAKSVFSNTSRVKSRRIYDELVEVEWANAQAEQRNPKIVREELWRKVRKEQAEQERSPRDAKPEQVRLYIACARLPCCLLISCPRPLPEDSLSCGFSSALLARRMSVVDVKVGHPTSTGKIALAFLIP